MDKLIELIEKHRNKWQKKWSKGTQLRDNNSEHYDQFLHGESVGATKAYNNVLQWMKNPSIMSREKDIALTKDDVWCIFNLVRELQTKYPTTEGCLQEVADIFNEQRKR